MSGREYIQGYRHGLTNPSFSRKLAQKEPTSVTLVLSKIQKLIPIDDYVRRKWELDNEVKEYQIPKKSKQIETKSKPKILDRLGPQKPESPCFE